MADPAAMRDVLKELFAAFDRRFAAAAGISGVPSGLADLDAITGGFQPGDLVLLAGRPATGRTALATTIARAACLPPGGFPVLYFAPGTSRIQLAERAIGAEARVGLELLRRGDVGRRDLTELTLAADRLAAAPWAIDDVPELSVVRVRARTRRWRERWETGAKPVGLVIVDSLELLMALRRPVCRHDRARVLRGLKALAQEVGCAVLVVATLPRHVEERDDPRPVADDLYELGGLGVADVVMLMFREELYMQGPTPDERRGVAEVILARNRHGPVGVVELAFSAATCRFDDRPRRRLNSAGPSLAPLVSRTVRESFHLIRLLSRSVVILDTTSGPAPGRLGLEAMPVQELQVVVPAALAWNDMGDLHAIPVSEKQSAVRALAVLHPEQLHPGQRRGLVAL